VEGFGLGVGVVVTDGLDVVAEPDSGASGSAIGAHPRLSTTAPSATIKRRRVDTASHSRCRTVADQNLSGEGYPAIAFDQEVFACGSMSCFGTKVSR
jgi:hypothetical protein